MAQQLKQPTRIELNVSGMPNYQRKLDDSLKMLKNKNKYRI